jgi:hypothetical protein
MLTNVGCLTLDEPIKEISLTRSLKNSLHKRSSLFKKTGAKYCGSE